MGDSINGNAGKQGNAHLRYTCKQPSEDRIQRLLEKKAEKKRLKVYHRPDGTSDYPPLTKMDLNNKIEGK